MSNLKDLRLIISISDVHGCIGTTGARPRKLFTNRAEKDDMSGLAERRQGRVRWRPPRMWLLLRWPGVRLWSRWRRLSTGW